MKKLFTFFSAIVLLGAASAANAQSFSVTHDTVVMAPPMTLTTVHDDIICASTVNLKWKVDVSQSDFPYDWMYNASGGTAFCDNFTCYSSSIDTNGTAISSTYPGGTSGTSYDFHIQLSLATATTTGGMHHMTIKFMSATDTMYETFIVAYPNVSVPTVKNADEVLLYPNPATSSVNIVYDASLDVKNVAIYNIIGKMMSIYKVNGNSANLNTENLNSGIYFIRLLNSEGNVILTRKFTTQ